MSRPAHAQIPAIADGDAPTLAQIRHNVERRLREIEPLIEEAQQLRAVLAAIERGTRRHAPRGGGHDHVEVAPRAAKGANKRVILELVGQYPGITPAEIAQATGMKRTVVASTVSRLKRQRVLRDHEQGGVRLADESAPARSHDLVRLASTHVAMP